MQQSAPKLSEQGAAHVDAEHAADVVPPGPVEEEVGIAQQLAGGDNEAADNGQGQGEVDANGAGIQYGFSMFLSAMSVLEQRGYASAA